MLQFAHERGVLFEQLPIVGADGGVDLFEIAFQIVQHAAQALLIFHPAVKFLEHLVRIIDRRNRLVAAGVDHARPGVGMVGNHHAEFQRAEARARFRLLLQKVFDFLIDRNAAGPTGRRIGTALDVAGIQLRACEQAADAAHVVVAVAAHLVAHAVQNEGLIAEWIKRRQAFREAEIVSIIGGPKRVRHHAVGAENNHQPPLALLLIREAQAGQIQHKRQRRGADAQVTQKLAARVVSRHVSALRFIFRPIALYHEEFEPRSGCVDFQGVEEMELR